MKIAVLTAFMLSRGAIRCLVAACVCVLAWPSGWARSLVEPPRKMISREVRHELTTLPHYGVFDDVKFRVVGGTVTLSGQVTSAELKDDAEKAVKSIAGVRKVDNQIQVLPSSSSDDRLRLAIYTATYGQPELALYAVRAVPLSTSS